MAKFPIPKFHFSVDLGLGGDIPFQEVTGLDQEFEFLEYRAGNDAEWGTRKRSGLMKTGQLSFKKGLFKGDKKVWDIFESLYKRDKYMSETDPGGNDLKIDLLDEKGAPVVTWNIVNAIPVKLSNADFKSDENAIAIEQIDFVFEKITSTYA
ncbi:phage tail protein [Saprospiraceae bacterium]|nr:phage tail protein [Saprospiraceae bacterium]